MNKQKADITNQDLMEFKDNASNCTTSYDAKCNLIRSNSYNARITRWLFVKVISEHCNVLCMHNRAANGGDGDDDNA